LTALPPTAAIRAGMTGNRFTMDRILSRAFEADLDGLFFSLLSRI
jgi:hypothetical protein